MYEKLSWAVIYNGRVRALFVTRWQAERFVETLHNKDEWSIKYLKEEGAI